jgi:Effector-associated domain 4
MPEKTKKKYTYGDKPRQRTQRMFELLLDCAFQEMVLETGETCTQISSGDLQYRYKLTKKGLTQIANRKDWKNGKGWEFNDVNDKRWKSEIYPALSHYLGDNFLEILEGGSQQGSSKWSFKIKLWHSEKAENLKIFAEKWEEAKNARSKAAIPQVKKADQSIYWRTACHDFGGTGGGENDIADEGMGMVIEA